MSNDSITHYEPHRGDPPCGAYVEVDGWSPTPSAVDCPACKRSDAFTSAQQRAQATPHTHRRSRWRCGACQWHGERQGAAVVDGHLRCPSCESQGFRGHYIAWAP